MTIAPPAPRADALAPLQLPSDLCFSPEQFAAVCATNPDAVLSPDASLVRLERWQALTPEQRRSFPPLCPDVLVELASPSDQGPRAVAALRQKMAAYQANGAQLGWLLIPEERAVEVWPVASEPHRIEAATQLDGGQLLPGLRIELQDIWQV